MSDLSSIEKRKLERLLGMGSGYVLNFSDRTFSEFFGGAHRDRHRPCPLQSARYVEGEPSPRFLGCRAGSRCREGDHRDDGAGGRGPQPPR